MCNKEEEDSPATTLSISAATKLLPSEAGTEQAPNPFPTISSLLMAATATAEAAASASASAF